MMGDFRLRAAELAACDSREAEARRLLVPSLALLVLSWGANQGRAQQLQPSQQAGALLFPSAGSESTEGRASLVALPESLSVTRVPDPWSTPFMAGQRVSTEPDRGEPQLWSDQTPAGDPASGTPPERAVSWKGLAPNFLQDQKHIWLFPAHVAKGKHWKPAVAFVVGTVGLVSLDPLEAPYFRSTTAYHTFNQVFSTSHTEFVMAAVPATFYAASLLRHDAYDQHTTMFAAEAVLDSTLVETVMKLSFRRLRPVEVPKGANFWDTFTDAKGGLFSGQPGFPSGHSITAFSIATVFAERYSRHRWVPWVAYGLATAIGFSRVTLQAHFASDVFVGAVLGYSISHYVVLQQ